MWTVCITSIRHVLKLKGYGEPQAKANEKRQRFKGWETLVYNYYTKEEISWDTLFREYSLPEDYHYHYDKYYQEFKNNGHKLDSIFIVKKRGVKLWLIARE